MDKKLLIYALIMAFGVFISACSQVLLKKSSQEKHKSKLKEYLNPKVIIAYFIFFAATLLSIYAYKVVPLSMGPIIEATSYIYVSVFGVLIFKEKLSRRKLAALIMIISGIIIYSVLG